MPENTISKFVQLAVCTDSTMECPSVYALDQNGTVWAVSRDIYGNVDGWVPFPMARLK